MAKKSKGNENKFCAVCWTIASVCYLISAVLSFVNDGFTFIGFTNLCCGITFSSLAVCYYSKMKNDNK